MSIANKSVLPLAAVLLFTMASAASAYGAGSAGNTNVHVNGTQNAGFFSSIFGFFALL
jgi:hypothetical protein